MNFWVTVKKLNERGKQIQNAKLERVAKSHEISAYICVCVYIYIYIEDYSFITPNQ